MPKNNDGANEKAARVGAGTKGKTLYMHIDGINTSAHWRLADYQNQGALSEDNLATLDAQFDLPQPVLQTLSLEVGSALDEESATNTVPVSENVAVGRANDALETCARLAKQIEHNLATMKRLLDPLANNFASADEQLGVLALAKQKTEGALRATSGLHDAIDRVIKLPGSAAILSPDDKRKIRDNRRWFVVMACCHAWNDAGRPVTYTSRPDRSTEKRGGPLIDFIQAVVMMVTDPPSHISVETIRTDIDRWKRENPAGGEVLMPPQEGNQDTFR